MQDIKYIKDNTKYSLLFLHGWEGNKKSLSYFYNFFKNKYSCYFLSLYGFDKEDDQVYTISNYLDDIKDYIDNNQIKNVVLIGYSFGGKLAFYLKKERPKYILISIAPSIIKNPFSLITYIKIKIYKLLKIFKIKIPSFFLGSSDYRNSKGNKRKTFLNVVHKYFIKKDFKIIDKGLVIGFKNDAAVKIKSLRQIHKFNKNIMLKELDGDHYSIKEYASIISMFINEFIKDEYDNN